jgi:hypothetical protein
MGGVFLCAFKKCYFAYTKTSSAIVLLVNDDR